MPGFEVTLKLWEELERDKREYTPQELRKLYVPQFLENTRKKRDEILAQPNLIEQIKRAVIEGPWEGHNSNFCRLGEGLALKARDPYFRKVAMAVKTSLYHPKIPITSFAVIIIQNTNLRLEDYLYLLEDLGNIDDFPIEPKLTERIQEQVKFLDAYLKSRGYYNNEGRPLKVYGVNGRDVALMDLDCREMVDSDEIFIGTINGRGQYGDLKEIFSKLAKYNLRI